MSRIIFRGCVDGVDEAVGEEAPNQVTIIKVIALRMIADAVSSAVRPRRASGPDLFRPARTKVTIVGEEVATLAQCVATQTFPDALAMSIAHSRSITSS
jgi:hypothetical protein